MPIARDLFHLSQPGLGAVLGARVLAEFGHDTTRYAHARACKNYAGLLRPARSLRGPSRQHDDRLRRQRGPAPGYHGRRHGGDHEAADQQFAAAVTQERRIGAVGDAAVAQVEHASVLVQRDPRRALELAQAAERAAGQLRMPPVQKRATALVTLLTGPDRFEIHHVLEGVRQ